MTTPFQCPNCEEGTIADRAIAGRKTMVMPGVEVELPSDLVLPTCDRCLDYTVAEKDEDEFIRVSFVALQQWQRRVLPGWVKELQETHSVTVRQIAATLDLPWPKFHQIVMGEEPAPVAMLRLLRIYTRYPDEFRHVRDVRSLESPTRRAGEAIDPRHR